MIVLPQSVGGSVSIASRLISISGSASMAAWIAAREAIAIDGERAAGRQTTGISRLHDQRAAAPHFFVQQPDRIVLGIVGAQRIRADELGEVVGAVCVGGAQRPHLVQYDARTSPCGLPRRLATGEAAADDMDGGAVFTVSAHGGPYSQSRAGGQGDRPPHAA